MKAIKSWTVSEGMWAKVEPLIPARKREKRRKYRRKVGGGRKRLDARKVFEGIVYVLRTGCQWKALPAERFGSASAGRGRRELNFAGLTKNLSVIS